MPSREQERRWTIWREVKGGVRGPWNVGTPPKGDRCPGWKLEVIELSPTSDHEAEVEKLKEERDERVREGVRVALVAEEAQQKAEALLAEAHSEIEMAILECSEGTVTGAEKAQRRLEAIPWLDSTPTTEQGETPRCNDGFTQQCQPPEQGERCGGSGKLWTQSPKGAIGSLQYDCPGCIDCQRYMPVPEQEGESNA